MYTEAAETLHMPRPILLVYDTAYSPTWSEFS